MHVVLREPDGNELESPEPNYIKDLILNKGSDYWELGSGDAHIYFIKKKANSIILIYCNELAGFYIEYIPEPGVYDTFIATVETSLYSDVVLTVSGEKHLVPLQTVIPRNEAFKIIEHFCASGYKYSHIKWLRKSEIEWPIDEDL